jgi:GMP synthase (glutamine-hydrolysing)
VYNAAVPRVRVIQHVAAEVPGLIGEALLEAGVDVALTRIDRGDKVPQTLLEDDALVVLGGPMAVYEANELKHLKQEMALIELAMMADKPVLGVCLGSQLLATVIGADVRKGERPEIGFLEVKLSAAAKSDPLLGGLPEKFSPLHWHGDIYDVPFGAEVLASSEQTAVQAFVKGSAWGLLFHLEPSVEQVEAMARDFAHQLTGASSEPEALVKQARESAAQLRVLGRSVFGAFAAQVAGGSR